MDNIIELNELIYAREKVIDKKINISTRSPKINWVKGQIKKLQ